jgi:predicted HD phosphohydrolase
MADENVTQRQHALQTALLAEQEAGKEAHEVVTSALLHDIGHLLLDEHAGEDSFLEEDLEHEVVGQAWLTRYFSPAVTLPVLYHVPAKRYWTSVDQQYYDGLSISSKRSLAVQGGPFTPEEAEEFIKREGAQDAVALRLWDDRGKEKGKETPPLEYFKPHVMKCL